MKDTREQYRRGLIFLGFELLRVMVGYSFHIFPFIFRKRGVYIFNSYVFYFYASKRALIVISFGINSWL